MVTDSYGNRYFRERGRRPVRRGGGRASREKRWVIYNGASRPPAADHRTTHLGMTR